MPVRKLVLPFRVQEQIEEALVYTWHRFGQRKHAEYEGLIEKALQRLESDAEAGDERPDIGRGVWFYPISREGGRARHVFLYSVTDDEVQIEAFRYDGMDLPARWPRK